jgi:hypothetical protein
LSVLSIKKATATTSGNNIKKIIVPIESSLT